MTWRRQLVELPSTARAVGWRLRRVLPAVIAALGGAVLLTGVYMGHGFITTSERFAISAIEVRGNRMLSTTQVESLAAISAGQNIFRTELGALATRLERNPWIAAASVRRGLPDTLIIEIEEERPAALVELGGLYLADRQGRVFKRAAVERGDGQGLPVLTGLSRDDYIERPSEVEQAISDALDALATYRAGAADAVRPRIGEIHLHPRHGLIFLTYRNAVAIHLGRADTTALDRRLRALDIVWQSMTADERVRAHTVYADSSGRPERVTVAFRETE